MVRCIHQLAFLNLRQKKVDASYRPGSAGPYCAELVEPVVGRYFSTISAIKIGLDTAELWKRTKCIYNQHQLRVICIWYNCKLDAAAHACMGLLAQSNLESYVDP